MDGSKTALARHLFSREIPTDPLPVRIFANNLCGPCSRFVEGRNKWPTEPADFKRASFESECRVEGLLLTRLPILLRCPDAICIAAQSDPTARLEMSLSSCSATECYIGREEIEMETSIVYRLYWDNAKLNRNSYLGFGPGFFSVPNQELLRMCSCGVFPK